MNKNIRFKKHLFFLIAIISVAIIFALLGCKEVIIPVKGSKDARPITEEKLVEKKPAKEKLYDYREIELDNGMKVITLEDFSCPIVAFQVWYHVGSKNEDPKRQGFAHMFEHMMFKGTDRVSEKDHFNFIQMVGGTNNAYTSFDATVYLQTVPANQLELVLWLEAERMSFLRIDQDSFDTERKVVEEELRMRENRPYGTLFKKQFAELFKVHPYRWTTIGKLNHLRTSSVAELREFWKRNYVPNNATLIIVGAVKHEDAQILAAQYFGWIPRAEEPERVTIREPALEKPRTLIIDDENAPAGLVEVNWRTVPLGHKDETALDLLSAVLGGGNSSRLYRELVAQKQLAVSVEASTYNLEHDGVFYAQAMHSPDKDPNELLESIRRHIDKVRTEKINAEELAKARNQMLKMIVSQNLEINSKARMLGTAAVKKGDTSRVNTMLEDIRAVTVEEIQRVANQYLTNEASYTFIVKPNSKGAMAGEKDDESGLVTAQREETAPPPGRKGVTRPKTFPEKAPFSKLETSKFTPDFSTATLDNGLKVMVVPNHEVPFVSIKLGLLNGAWTEDKPGTASMAMDMLTKGTAKHSEGELAEELERYAISLNGIAGMDTCRIEANCLVENVDRAMELLTEILLEPAFDEAEFEKLRMQTITGLEVQAQKPDYLANKEFRKRIYGAHPYARTVTGEISDVKALQRSDLADWWKRICRPDTATLIIAGDIEKEKAMVLAEQLLGKWKADQGKTETTLADFPKAKETHIYVIDRPGSMQSQIRIGQFGITRHDRPEYFISRVVSNYFGWAFNSWLNESIRVNKGLTYYIGGSYNAKNLGGEFLVNTFSKTASTGETITAVIEEIKRLRNERPGEKELADSKSFFAGSFVRYRETPQQVAKDLWLIESQDLGADYLDQFLSKIAMTTEQDCLDLAKKTIDTDKLVIVVVGDASKIAEELKKIAPVTVLTEKKE